MPNGTYGGVRGRKTKVGRKLSFSSYSIVSVSVRMVLPSLTSFFIPSFLPGGSSPFTLLLFPRGD